MDSGQAPPKKAVIGVVHFAAAVDKGAYQMSMPAEIAPVAEEPAVVILVHGTFAYHDADQATPSNPNRWWQRGSGFCHRFIGLLGNGYRVAPSAGEEARGGESVFHWSGANRESNRRRAGRLLLRRLLVYERASIKYHVVAHSHGGSVLWEALRLATSERQEQPERPLPCLQTWTTVGTPFLHFVPDLAPFLCAMASLLALACVVWRQRLWIHDFWQQFSIEVTATALRKMLAVHLAYAMGILSCTFVVHFLFRAFTLWQAQSDSRSASEAPRVEVQRFWIANLVMALILSLLVLAAWLAGAFTDLRATSLQGLRSATAAWAVAYTVGTVSIGATFVWIALASAVQCLLCRRRNRLQTRSWKHFGARYWWLSSVRHDEATRGLTSITRSIRGPLLPRMAAPGTGVYSPDRGRLLEPEQQSRSILDYLMMPVHIIRDWVFRPVYNEVIARMLDDFVLRRLTRSAHGADIAGLCLGAVTVTPVAESPPPPEQRWRLADWWSWYFVPIAGEEDVRPTNRRTGLTAESEEALSVATRSNAGQILQQIRNALGIASPAATSLKDFLQRAMRGERDAPTGVGPMDVLVHTRYFEHEDVVALIARGIRGEIDPGAYRQLPPIDLRAARDDSPSEEAKPIEFTWWIVRGLILLLLLVSPAAAVWQYGKTVLYPHSREAGLAWAGSTDPALAATAEKLFALGAFNDSHTPSFVRWLAGMIANGRTADVAAFDRRVNSLLRNRFERVVLYAVTAEKLAELNECDLAKERLNQAVNLVSSPLSERDRLRVARFQKAQKTVAACATGMSADVILRARTPAEDELVRLVQSSRSLESSRQDSAIGLVRQVQQAVNEFNDLNEPAYVINALNLVLIIHQELLTRGYAKEAQDMADIAKGFCSRQEVLQRQKPGSTAYLTIESYVLTAKSLRWPLSDRRAAVALLAKAESLAAGDLLPHDRVKCLARVAAGYARLGYFPKAIALSAAADSEHRLLVAKEMLANEYELKELRSGHGTAGRLWEILQAFDEQVDRRHNGYDVAR